MNNSTSNYNDCEAYDFICYVIDEKRDILADSRRNPCQILMDVFDLCIDNFDYLDLQKNQPELYGCLMQLYDSNKKKPLIDSLEENFPNICSLLKIFSTHKDEIEKVDSSIYYALLGFIDLLKTNKGKRIYYRIVP